MYRQLPLVIRSHFLLACGLDRLEQRNELVRTNE